MIKILELKECKLSETSVLQLINHIFPPFRHFYDAYINMTREFYEAILAYIDLVEITHTFNEQNPYQISYSKISILRILTEEDWGLKPLSYKTLSSFPTIRQYNYYDYQDAWQRVLFLNNYRHLWFIYFAYSFNKQFPKWFIRWFKFYSLSPEALP